MLAMIAIPAGITLHTVHHPAPLIPLNQNSTPYGYTFSLLLFILPAALIGGWFLPSEGLHIPKRAFCWTLAILVPLGCLLDFVFAQWFFEYPNVGATLGLRAPALGRFVPVEEYVFYFTGFWQFFFYTFGSESSGWRPTMWLITLAKPGRCAGFCTMPWLVRIGPIDLWRQSGERNLRCRNGSDSFPFQTAWIFL
jgi:hypothetical protein